MSVDVLRAIHDNSKLKPDLGGTHKSFLHEGLFKDTVIIARPIKVPDLPGFSELPNELGVSNAKVIDRSRESQILTFRRRDVNLGEQITNAGWVAKKVDSSIISTGIGVLAKGSVRLRRGRRPRGRCPDCGAVYILSLGHSNCRSKKSESNIAIKSFSPVYFKKAA